MSALDAIYAHFIHKNQYQLKSDTVFLDFSSRLPYNCIDFQRKEQHLSRASALGSQKDPPAHWLYRGCLRFVYRSDLPDRDHCLSSAKNTEEYSLAGTSIPTSSGTATQMATHDHHGDLTVLANICTSIKNISKKGLTNKK